MTIDQRFGRLFIVIAILIQICPPPVLKSLPGLIAITTGERALGIARPSPDEFLTNETGNILTWYNTSGISYIEVNYYKNNAPKATMMIFAILAAAGVVLLVRYYISSKRLKDMKREGK